MSNFKSFLGSILAALTLTANIASAQSGSLTSKEQQFVSKLAQGSMAEVKLGGLAETKAKSLAVRQFGKRMVDDHTTLDNQLKKWASKEHAALPTQITPEDQSLQKKLSELMGPDFDRQYIQSMLEDHKKDIDEVRRVAETSKNQSLKNLAMKTLPILENHLRIAENIAGQLGLSASQGLDIPEHPAKSV